jgi:hypothetical protein
MTFKNLLDSDESDDKAVTAMGILTNFDTMMSVIESKEVSIFGRRRRRCCFIVVVVYIMN